MKQRIRFTAICLSLAAFGASQASAIPAFARKYETSCQTCHVAYPRLNAFGEAFRLLGYRMPGETEELVKRKPVSLGAPAWKRLFPKAVWPSDIPGSIPVAARVTSLTEWSGSGEGDERESVVADFQFPARLSLLGAGTFGERLSFFTKVELSRGRDVSLTGSEIHRSEEVEIDLEHAELHFNGLTGSPLGLNLKVGRFEPEVVGSSFSHMRTLTERNYLSLFAFGPIAVGGGAGIGDAHHGGSAGIALPATVEGIEAYGVAKSRLFWSLGISDGLGAGLHSAGGSSLKDVYGRLSYKFGGLGLDGTRGDAVVAPGAEKPWRDDSVKFGLFAYEGDGEGSIFTLPLGHEEEHGEEGDEHGGMTMGAEDEHGEEDDDHDLEAPSVIPIEDRDFTRFGADVHWFHKDLHLFAVWAHGEDDLRTFDPEVWSMDPGTLVPLGTDTFEYDSFMVEADYVIFPWLIGVLRYESLDPANTEARDYEWGVANMTGLVRANVKLFAEYQWDLNESNNYKALIGLDFAF